MYFLFLTRYWKNWRALVQGLNESS